MNVYSFTAIRGVQAGRAYYVAMVPLKTLERLFQFSEGELPPQLRAQRELNKARVPGIARYLTTNAGQYVLSALAATVDGVMRFEPADGHRSAGNLIVDMNATILINDGQHRRAGIIEALKERPHLGEETIAVTLFPDEGLARSQQMFVDLNQHGVKPSRSLRLFYDSRNQAAGLSRAVIDAIPLFRDLTDLTRACVSSGSRKLFAFGNIHSATATLVEEAGLDASEDNPRPAVEFWTHVIAAMHEWRLVGEGRLTAAELRQDRVHAHGVAMEAMAIAGARMMVERPIEWPESLQGLASIDWSRSNARLWEGRALVGGRINRSRTSVLLTAEVIHSALRKEPKKAN
ncbi:DNA sulfur modification protein DndB [Sphingosinicella terrae]|uniref:DNA sulfur modification protein DndB n=1 Tax=Sphingosinicella terrae TaxID=2172047 RepID=UPI000E0D3687|nr:DNA sulfur modification protein DndB [Sphingosinicella terrae]